MFPPPSFEFATPVCRSLTHQDLHPPPTRDTPEEQKQTHRHRIRAHSPLLLAPQKDQKGLEVCYCLWRCHPDPRLGPILGPSRSHPGSEVVPSRFAMCFVLQCFGPIQVPRWGPSRPVLIPSCSQAFLPGSGLDGPKQTSCKLPNP